MNDPKTDLVKSKLRRRRVTYLYITAVVTCLVGMVVIWSFYTQPNEIEARRILDGVAHLDIVVPNDAGISEIAVMREEDIRLFNSDTLTETRREDMKSRIALGVGWASGKASIVAPVVDPDNPGPLLDVIQSIEEHFDFAVSHDGRRFAFGDSQRIVAFAAEDSRPIWDMSLVEESDHRPEIGEMDDPDAKTNESPPRRVTAQLEFRPSSSELVVFANSIHRVISVDLDANGTQSELAKIEATPHARLECSHDWAAVVDEATSLISLFNLSNNGSHHSFTMPLRTSRSRFIENGRFLVVVQSKQDSSVITVLESKSRNVAREIRLPDRIREIDLARNPQGGRSICLLAHFQNPAKTWPAFLYWDDVLQGDATHLSFKGMGVHPGFNFVVTTSPRRVFAVDARGLLVWEIP